MRDCTAAAWKVNGAGGEGGSLTILCGQAPGAALQLSDALVAADSCFQILPVRLCHSGVRAWDASTRFA
jgi:D-glycero-alpha-D-manno-heptose-7-phosphate kinase